MHDAKNLRLFAREKVAGMDRPILQIKFSFEADFVSRKNIGRKIADDAIESSHWVRRGGDGSKSLMEEKGKLFPSVEKNFLSG